VIPFSSYYTLEMQINGESMMNMISLNKRLVEYDIDKSEYFYLPTKCRVLKELTKCPE